MRYLTLFAVCAVLRSGFAAITSLPNQQTGISTTSTYTYSDPALSLSAVTYSYAYTVTTPTTHWEPPTFQTASPLPPCSDSVCPTYDRQECVDSEGIVYGVLCNTLFSGIVITNSGKFLEKEKRSYTGTFEGCTAFCDTYNITYCTGVQYEYGECLAYDTITGTFPNPAGGFAAIRQPSQS